MTRRITHLLYVGHPDYPVGAIPFVNDIHVARYRLNCDHPVMISEEKLEDLLALMGCSPEWINMMVQSRGPIHLDTEEVAAE